MTTRLGLLLVLTLVPLGLSGCTIAVSEHPLSNADTSQVDERLVGTWQQLGRDGKPDKDAQPFELIRHPKMPNVIQAVPRDAEQRRRMKPGEDELFTTAVGKHRFVSVLMGRREKDDPSGSEKSYVVCLYEMSDDKNEVSVFLMDFEAVGQAIEQRELGGMVQHRPPQSKPKPDETKTKYKAVRITARPKELAAWLQKNAATCYLRDRPLRLRRVVEKQPQTDATRN